MRWLCGVLLAMQCAVLLIVAAGLWIIPDISVDQDGNITTRQVGLIDRLRFAGPFTISTALWFTAAVSVVVEPSSSSFVRVMLRWLLLGAVALANGFVAGVAGYSGYVAIAVVCGTIAFLVFAIQLATIRRRPTIGAAT
jgi:hypothetical protein